MKTQLQSKKSKRSSKYTSKSSFKNAVHLLNQIKLQKMEGITPARSHPIHFVPSYTVFNCCAKWDHSTVAHTCWIIDGFDMKCSSTATHIKSSLWPWECDLWVARLSKLPQKSMAALLRPSVLSVCGLCWLQSSMVFKQHFVKIFLRTLFPLKRNIYTWISWLKHNLMFLLTFGYPHLRQNSNKTST